MFDVVVTGMPAARHSLTSIRRAPHRHAGRRPGTAGGRRGGPRRRPSPTVIRREAASRRIDIGADVGRARPQRHRLRRRAASRKRPTAPRVPRRGARRVHGAAGRRAADAGLRDCRRDRHPPAPPGGVRKLALRVSLLPQHLFALVGGVVAAFIAGGTISLGSLVGFFAVFGIAARNGILLVNRFQHLEREEGEAGPELILRGNRRPARRRS